MATSKLLVIVLLLENLNGELFSNFNLQPVLPFVPSTQVNKTKVLVDLIIFRNFRKKNGTLSADYEIESNDIALEFPRTGTVKGHLSPVQDNLGNQNTDAEVLAYDKVIIKLLDKERGQYNFVTNYFRESSHPEKEETEYEPSKKNIFEVRGESVKSTERNTVNRENKFNNKVIDDMVDFLLQILRDGLHRTGRDQIVIPNVDEEFYTDIIFIPVKGRFRAEDGWFKNLSTIYRTGEVEVTTSQYEISVKFDLGLKITQFGYNKYDAQLGAIEASGSLLGSISSDSIATKISFVYVNETCRARLDSLKVTYLNGIYVSLTGWEGFGWLLSFIANCVSGSYHDQIIHAVEQMLSKTLQENLEKLSCGHLFPSTLNY